MVSGAYLFAQSCVEPDLAFDSLQDLALWLADMAKGRPVRCRTAAVARGPRREAGFCVAVAVSWRLAFEHVGYAFLPGTLCGDEAALRKALHVARAQPGLARRFEEVALQGGVGLAVAA